jgi:RNAse (barnase) inhibitor barstar
MAAFRLDHDELRHELPWRLMQNGPVTKYLSRDIFAADLDELEKRGYRVARFDCSSWNSEDDLHADLKRGLSLPDYTGANYDALEDSLADIDVPESGGLTVALDNFTEANRSDVLLDVLAHASRWWLLFGRIFAVATRTDDARYEGPVVGGTRPHWSGNEWLNADRAL